MKCFFCSSHAVNKKYAWELVLLNHFRNLKDGITFCECTVDVSWYKADHNPKFSIHWILLNWVIIEFNIYNINHIKE